MGSLNLSRIPLSPAPAPGTPGAYFGTEVSVVLAVSATSVLPIGIFLVGGVAGIPVEYSNDGGTTWVLLMPGGTGGLVVSDGTNVRLSATTAGTARYLPVN